MDVWGKLWDLAREHDAAIAVDAADAGFVVLVCTDGARKHYRWGDGDWHFEEEAMPLVGECPGCHGTGRFDTECCSGAGGCDCRGEVIDIGPCRVCEGTGGVDGTHNPEANLNMIRGMHFIGSGPAGMESVWPNRGNLVRR